VLVILLACHCALSAQASSTKDLSSCAIYTDRSHDGTMVRIRAFYAGSFEGSYLIDIKCNKALWFTTPEGKSAFAAILVRGPYPKVAKTDFALVEDKEYEVFTRFAYATVENLEPAYKVTATFTGRLDRSRNFKLGRDGFGQMGQSEFQLVLQSVTDVEAEEAELIPLIHSTLPNRLEEL
jgi:hypothetical protein